MFVQGWMFGISGEALTLRVRQLTFKALLRQEIAYFDDPNNPTGALTTRLATDASAIQGATGFRMGMMLQAVGSLSVGIIIGFIFSWKFALFILGTMPFIMVSAVVQMQLAKGFAGKNNEALEGAGKVSTEAITNIRTIASLTKEDAFLEAYRKLTDPTYRANLRQAHVFGIAFCATQSMIFFTYAAVFYFGAWLVVNDHLEYKDMFIVFISIVFGAISIGKESQFGPDYGKAKTAAARIFAVLDKNPGAMDSYSQDGAKPVKCLGTVEFKDVKFSYPTRASVKVLRGLNMKVEQGYTMALVGSSGCGKSTTVQLLERFYDPTEGQVCIDGQNVTSLNVGWLRAQIGLVSQEPVLFDYSIKENIAYGDNSRTVSMDEIIAAAREANIHNFIQSLPNGYETSAGDKGTQLSGGQKQRIAIARALLRNPKILLLDEATSALDTESEKIVQDALDRAQQGRTSLVIAHRLSTIQNANCIVVFQNGRIAEQGTHSELISQKGLYYKLNVAQGNRK
jgi:ATP-binding cassette subfamily B (MDR/TAP) protein 1